MVLLLHGCDQTAEEFAAATRFTTLADRHGFVLVAPKQGRTYHPGGCWRWYAAAHQSRRAGEPAILAGIVETMLAEPSRWRIDRSRVYVAGISAGAGMALILGATCPDVFAAVGVHSGPAYRSATSTRAALGAMNGRGVPPPAVPAAAFAPLIVFHGTSDGVVDVRNGDQVTEQWLAHDAVRAPGGQDSLKIRRSRTVERTSPDGRRYSVTRWYGPRGRTQLEYWRIEGLGHAWSGGRRDASYSDPRGPRASTAMWTFFAGHRL
jgi:poly(hydroxyalkanoate) depolymerase family esterase